MWNDVDTARQQYISNSDGGLCSCEAHMHKNQ
jgi:hypothetical protein